MPSWRGKCIHPHVHVRACIFLQRVHILQSPSKCVHDINVMPTHDHDCVCWCCRRWNFEQSRFDCRLGGLTPACRAVQVDVYPFVQGAGVLNALRVTMLLCSLVTMWSIVSYYHIEVRMCQHGVAKSELRSSLRLVKVYAHKQWRAWTDVQACMQAHRPSRMHTTRT